MRPPQTGEGGIHIAWNNGVGIQLGITNSYQRSTRQFARQEAIRYGSNNFDALFKDQLKFTMGTGEGINLEFEQKCIRIGNMPVDEIPLAPPSLNVGER